MLSKINSVATVGLEAIPVTVEVDIASTGLPHFIIVGLPNKAIDEAKERVRSAIRNSGLEFPNKKITVNLAPADVPKEGSGYDLPIALGILASSGQIPPITEKILVYGELSLDGTVRPCSGSVLFSILARELGYDALFVPQSNVKEAALIDGTVVYACKTLKDVVGHFTRESVIAPHDSLAGAFTPGSIPYTFDMADVHGQAHIKRAMEISAAGSHNLILVGSPGSGKTMLARTFPTILPDLTLEEAIELTKLYSIAGLLPVDTPFVNIRPFRSPHHTSSVVSLVGGGSQPKPGEISLSHRGVLFLDELLEFPKAVLEALRQPLEDGNISVSRAAFSVTYPAKFILLAACNPCPCGYAGNEYGQKQCNCTSSQIQRYRKRLSGPILDRIDLQVSVRPVPLHDLTTTTVGEQSESIRSRVQNARSIQQLRFANSVIKNNSEMGPADLQRYCVLGNDSKTLLKQAVVKLKLSARSYTRVIKVSRTIADLASAEHIGLQHVAEALRYRFSNEFP